MFKQIFTWWNGQTLGTKIWSYFNGTLVGLDDEGNKYYRNKDDTKRWVIYSGIIESTLVSPEWNNWLRYTSLTEPIENKKYNWQKEHTPNLTGTPDAFDPKANRKIEQNSKRDDYKRWSPKN